MPTDHETKRRPVRAFTPLMGAVAALCATLCATIPAVAQGWIDPVPRGTEWGVVRVGTDVTVRVDARVAEVVVDEWFENRGAVMGEGDYLYPLPGEAVFSSFSLYQGDEELRGETLDAEQARRVYEEIVRRKRDPALIELVGHGLVRARVFPIEPGQRRRITLRYTQVLERAGEAVQFRYAAGARSPARHPHPGPAVSGPDSAPVSFTLLADPAAYGEPFSPTHPLDVDRWDGRIRVRPVSEPTGDLSLFLPVAGDGVGIALATHRTDGDAGYFMLTLSPGAAGRGVTPRDITAVVDVSGSMSGTKLAQTRAALHQLLGSLGRADRFRLVAFSSRVRASSDGWSPASAAAVRDARRWVDGLEAVGGTDIAGALEEALRLDSPEDRLPIVVFLTDGLPTVGEQNPERIARTAEARRGRARVFAFGVGYDVHTYLLDRLGQAGRGSTAYVAPGEDVERALSSLAVKISHPVLTDLEIAGAPVRLGEIYPGEMPDLFAGEELVVFGRYTGAGAGTLGIRGRRGGTEKRFATAAEFPRRAETNAYIPRLWASRKLGELSRQIRLNGADPELVEELRRTALRYGLLSDYTSYLVQEPGAALAGPETSRALRAPALDMARAPVAGAPAGAPASGRVAVAASERSRARREVASAADLARSEVALEASLADTGAGVRLVAGRTFRLQEGVWTEGGEEAEPAPADTLAIAAFSDAYFALLRALPELRPVVAELAPVMVRGDRLWLRFGDEGLRSLSDRELTRTVAGFRAR